MTLLFKPDKGSGDADEAKIMAGNLVIAREDTAVVFDFVDETLDQMAFSVEMLVIEAQLLAI